MKIAGTSFRRPPGTRGFTLIEVLVVIVIIGVLVTVISLRVSGRATDDKMQSEGRRLEQLFRMAEDEAQINGHELGFRHTDEGFEFLGMGANGDWEPIPDGLFRPREIAKPFYLELRVEGRLIKPAPTGDRDVATAPGKEPEAKKDAKKDDDSSFDNVAHKKAEEKLQPQVMILSTGEMTAFDLDLRLKDYRRYYRLTGDDLGTLKTEVREDKR